MNKKINILVVDDVEFSRELLRSAVLASIDDDNLPLEAQFFHVANGEGILEVIELQKITIAYLDIDLPDENGLELLNSIKQRFADVTVVMVSAEGSSENVMQAIKSGANGFIVKPFNTARINASLRNYLKQGE